jgi:hypothetical protein
MEVPVPLEMKELDREGELKLLEFLAKVEKACEGDSSLPSIIGTQVKDWIKEIPKEDGPDEGTGGS